MRPDPSSEAELLRRQVTFHQEFYSPDDSVEEYFLQCIFIGDLSELIHAVSRITRLVEIAVRHAMTWGVAVLHYTIEKICDRSRTLLIW